MKLTADRIPSRHVSILIVTWNSADTIGRCLEALPAACDGVRFETLIWDNDSSDGTVAIAAERSNTHVIRSDNNVGFARGINELALRASGRYLLLLNPDAYLESASVGKLLDRARLAGQRAVVGGLLVYPNGSPQLASARPFPSGLQTAAWLLGRRRYWWQLPSTAQRVDAVSGGMMLVSLGLWQDLGGFDEEYRHSSEDLDLCFRVARIGGEVWYEPLAIAVHEHQVSVKKASPEVEVHRWMGILRFVELREGRRRAQVLRRALMVQTATAVLLTRLGLRHATPSRACRTNSLRFWLRHGWVPPLPSEPQPVTERTAVSEGRR